MPESTGSGLLILDRTQKVSNRPMYLYVLTDLLNEADDEDAARLAEASFGRELVSIGENAKLSHIDIGRGASADAFKVLLDWLPALSPIALFFFGSQIEKNLDAWISIAHRFSNLLSKIRMLGPHPVITFEAACAVALDEIVTNEWHEAGFEIEHIVASNKHGASHAAFASMDDLKTYIEQDRRDDYDPLSIEMMYTFFGRSDTKLFIVAVDGHGSILFAKQMY